MLWTVYGHFQEIKKFNIIQSLVQSNSYTTATIVDILITESKGRNRTTYYYTYVCKDFASWIEYKSEFFRRKDLYTIWYQVPVYHDDIGYPGVYWIDLDAAVASSIGDNLREYHIDKIETAQKKFRTDYKNG